MPHDVSTNTSDGEGLDRRSSAVNSADEDMADHSLNKSRHSRSKRVKQIDASEGVDLERYGERVRRARSVTSESGNDDFTGSEFGATVGKRESCNLSALTFNIPTRLFILSS